ILVSNMATMGIGALLVQELPRQQTDRAWSTVITAGLVACTVASMFAGMVAAFILPFISGEFAAAWRQAPYAILLIISMPIWSIATLLDQLFIAERSAGNMLARNTAFAVLKLALLATSVVFIQTGATSIYVTWILGTAASIIGGIVLVVRQLKHVYRPVFRGMGEQLRSMFSSLVGHHLISVASLAPMYLLSVFVAARLNAADAGYFYTTWMLGSMFF